MNKNFRESLLIILAAVIGSLFGELFDTILLIVKPFGIMIALFVYLIFFVVIIIITLVFVGWINKRFI